MRKSMVHVSFDLVEKFTPRIPAFRIEGEFQEDSKTERICASSTILGALRGIPQGGKTLYQMKQLGLPILIHAYYLEGAYVVPTDAQVPDRCITDEVWFLREPEKIRRVDYLITHFELLPVKDIEHSFYFVLDAKVERCPYGDNKENLCSLFQKKMPDAMSEFSFRQIITNLGEEMFSLKEKRGL